MIWSAVGVGAYVLVALLAPGVSLTLNPLPTIDGSTFPAFVHCANLNPQ